MMMSLLGSLVTRRRFGKPSAQSSLGIAAIHKAPGSAVAATTAVLAGLFAGTFYLNKQDSAAEVTGEEAGKEVGKEAQKEAGKEVYLSREGAIKAGFVNKDGVVNWNLYIDYVNSQRYHGGRPIYKEEVKEATEEVVKLKDVKVDEVAMKARFEDWMKEYGRAYKTEEEKARRYEIFKQVAISADKFNASKPSGARIAAPNGLADLTDEEWKRYDNDFDWETFIARINKAAANNWYISSEQFTVSEAVKKLKEQSAKEAEGRCDGDKSQAEKR